MSALARWCHRHRFIVISTWICVLIGLTLMSTAVKASYDNSFTLDGTGSGRAQALLHQSAPAQAGDSDQIVWHVDQGTVTDPAVRQRLSAMLEQVSHLPEVASVDSPYLPGGEVQVAPDGHTAFATLTFAKAADNLDPADVKHVIAVAKAARQPGLDVELGGQAVAHAEQAPLSAVSAVGIAGAAVILLIAFGSLFAMALPIATAVAGVSSGLMLMAPLSHLMSVTGIAPILGALIGLGVGVDYALFIVTRHRRGLKSGIDPQTSTVTALTTSGRAVLFAGGTVCIALLGLLTLGQSFLDGLAFAAVITVACTVLAAVTLLPALFGVFGLRVLSRRERRRLLAGEVDDARNERGLWARWARAVPRFRTVLSAAAVALMLLVSLPVLHLRLGFADASNDPASSSSRKAYEMVADGFGPGFNGPLFLVAQTRSAADRAALDRLDHALAGVPGVAAVQTRDSGTGSAPAGSPAAAPAVTVTQVLPATAPETPATSALISTLRNNVIPSYTRGTTLEVYVGGLTATFDDFAAVSSAKLPWLLAAIVGSSFLLLVIAFRSLLIPAITAAVNLLSAAASFGVLTAVFQWGWGTGVLGIGAPTPVEGYLPGLVLAILFGLSLDYQVFLVSRMAEEWSHSRDNARAVIVGQTDTARVITAAAAIMIAVFVTFVFLGQVDVAEFGVGLAAAVALDAFVLRTVLVPALMHLFGRANWWLPGWLDRRLPHLAVEAPAPKQRASTTPQSSLV
ncbi:MAG: MMPL family transporter [Catenulispora sp.]|nr:MMPL family transporter [Catenulispora sp.]